MTLKRAALYIKILCAAAFLLLLGAFFTGELFFNGASITLVIIAGVLHSRYMRCPHCGGTLTRLQGGCCPHCGKMVEED